jgi:leucyl aminopeptidase
MKMTSLGLTLGLMGASFLASANSQFEFVNTSNKKATTQVVFVSDAEALTGAAANIDKASQGQLGKLLALNDFSAELGSVQHLQMLAGIDSLLIVGTKDKDGLDTSELQNVGGSIAAHLKATTKQLQILMHIDSIDTSVNAPSAYIASGFHMRDYSFDKYKTVKDEGSSQVQVVTPNPEAASDKYHNDLKYLAEGVHMARDFATEPGLSMYPEAFADVVKAKFKGLKNIKVRILDVRDMEKNNMGALLGVGKGSVHDPRLVIIEYTGGDNDNAPLALAGKGITFDTGGISLKGNDGMWGMKADLSGAAAVAGTMYALAKRGEKVNVVGLMALAENMPSRDAIRPGDVLQTMQGTSIEIISTDAEGRLVLADAVYYAQQKYKPSMLLNIATLTGSAARALSDEYAALITRDFDLSVKMMEVGKRSGELVWPLPLHPNHFEQIKSPIADIKNSGAGNPGASIGAAVVGTFVDESMPWVHIDMAGVDWLSDDIDVAPKGSQGWGVRFMDQLVREQNQ